MMEEKCCPHCGKQLQENAIFCPFCMRSLQDKTAITPLKYRRRKWLVLVAVVVLISMLVCGVWYYQTRPCEHNWEPIEEIIHHDAVGYMDLVITGYEKKTVYYCHYEPDKYIACFSMDGMRRHMEENHSKEPNYDWVMDNLESLTIIQEEEIPTYGYSSFDQPAYDETIVTGQRCSKCGEIRQENNPGSS